MKTEIVIDTSIKNLVKENKTLERIIIPDHPLWNYLVHSITNHIINKTNKTTPWEYLENIIYSLSLKGYDLSTIETIKALEERGYEGDYDLLP